MTIRKQRLMERLEEIGSIGMAQNGAHTRLAFSQEYFQAARVLADLAKSDLDCQVFRDVTGSIHIVRKGSERGKKPIVVGSHLDTVPNGGRYDGLAGIVSAFEVMQSLQEEGITLRRDLHLVAFNAEEAGPLGGTFSSRGLLGQISLKEPRYEAYLERAASPWVDLPMEEPKLEDAACFVELHIEQGGILDEKQVGIGVVTGIFGIRRYRIRLKGQSNHAGTTTMNQRKDAVVSAGRLILYTYQEALNYGEGLVATIGKVDVHPNLESIVPGEAELTLELRSLSSDDMDEILEKIIAFGNRLGSEESRQAGWPQTEFEIETLVEKPPCLLDDGLMQVIEEACRHAEADYIPLPSGAGHDAKSFAMAGIPTGMIFIPSIGGRSHCPEELTLPEQLERGAQVLYETVRELDESLSD